MMSFAFVVIRETTPGGTVQLATSINGAQSRLITEGTVIGHEWNFTHVRLPAL